MSFERWTQFVRQQIGQHRPGVFNGETAVKGDHNGADPGRQQGQTNKETDHDRQQRGADPARQHTGGR